MGAKKKRCRCFKVGDYCLASCIWTIEIGRRARQKSIVFWRRSGPFDVRQATGAGARSVRVWWALFRVRIGVWAGSVVGKPTQTTKHVLHMFCERTIINIRHVACWWRGTAFSRRRPPVTHAAACSRSLPVASDAVAFLMPVVAERTHFCVAGMGIAFFWHATKMDQERAFGTIWNARASSSLVILTLLYLHKQTRAQKTTFAYLARTFLRDLYFRVYWDFARCFGESVLEYC